MQPVAALDGAVHPLFALHLQPAHEDYNAYMPRELVDQWEAWDPDQALPDELPGELIGFYRDLLGQMLAGWPDEVREPLVDRHVSPAWLRTGLQEAKDLGQLNDEMRQAGPLPDVPLIILTGTGIDAFKRAVSPGTPESLLRAEIDGKLRLYQARADSVPVARTAWSRAPGTPPCTGAIPARFCRPSRTCSARAYGWSSV